MTKLAADGRLASAERLHLEHAAAVLVDPFWHNAGLIPNHATRNLRAGVHPRAEASGRVPHRCLADGCAQAAW
jgi:hypothetical protein